MKDLGCCCFWGTTVSTPGCTGEASGGFPEIVAGGSSAPVVLRSSTANSHVQPRWEPLLLRKGSEGSLGQWFSNVTSSVTLMSLGWDLHICIFKTSVGRSCADEVENHCETPRLP